MSQHDIVLDNAPGQAVRLDMNAAILALVTQNSGPVEPLVKYAGMIWLDTSVAPQGVVRQRNLANNAWVAFQIGAQDLGVIMQLLPSKATPVDADDLLVADSADSWKGKRTKWTSVRAYVVALFNATEKVTPVDSDLVYQGNSAASYAPANTNWGNIKAFLKTYFDPIYQATLGLTKATGQASGIYSHGFIAQAGVYPLQIYAPAGGQPAITFHAATQFAKNFGMDGVGNLYEGGISHGELVWPMISTRNLATYSGSTAALYGIGSYLMGEINGQGNTADYAAGTQIAGAYIHATGWNSYDDDFWDSGAAIPGTWMAMGRLVHPGGAAAPVASLVTLFQRIA